ncbi:MAG: SdpI family protein [Patescibacteria group bacterium]|jgi:uncharacterized membrane protein|nr:SdpI family protein [Patescibacteria group bacterium]
MKSPIKISIKSEIISILFITVSIIASFYFYNNFPDQVPTHWNIEGNVDDWSTPLFAAFLLPIISIGLYLLFLVLPRIDPKKDRYKQFANIYHIFKTIVIGFLSLIYFVTSFSALGYDINITRVISISVGLLFLVLGNYMSKIKRNWFLGIRTPWTLSSEDVWNKTHRLGGKMFVLSGFLMMSMSYLDTKYRIPLFVTIIILTAVVSFVYSYYLFNKEQKNGNK